MICDFCGRDLNEIWQDNCSTIPGVVCCEDCIDELDNLSDSEDEE